MKIVRGLASVVALLVIVAGMPALLIAAAPIGLPTVEWSLPGLATALLSPDDGRLMLTLIKIVGWIAWAVLTIAIVIEIVAALRGRPAPTLRGLVMPQRLAQRLVSSAAILMLTAGGTVGSAATALADGSTSTAAATTPSAAPEPVAVHQHAPRAKAVVVHRGDTLSGIALRETGHADRYRALFAASRHTVQPGGRHLSDPDLILPGWRITIPAAGAPKRHTPKHEQAPQHHSAPAPQHTQQVSAPTQKAAPPQPAAPTRAPAQDSAPHTVPVEVQEISPAWLLSGLAGAGALLAGAMWLVWQRRRAGQRRLRRPGRSIVAHPVALAPVEKTLMREGGLTSQLVVFLDEILRRLAAATWAKSSQVPVLVGVDVTEETLTLRLAESFALSAPWQQLDRDGQLWRVERGVDIDELGPLEADSAPPWPQLVTLGQDQAGWRVVNLEALGVVSITGDQVYGADLARYLAAELAFAPWARDVEIDCVEVCAELEGMVADRLRCHHTAGDVAANAVEAAVATVDRLDGSAATLEASRALQAGEELWGSRVVISSITDQTLDVLVGLVQANAGRTATSLLLVDDTATAPVGVELHLTAQGRVVIPSLGLDLVPNGLTAPEALGCAAVLAAAGPVDEPMPEVSEPTTEWESYVRADGGIRDELTVPRGVTTTELAVSLLPGSDEQYVTQTANVAEDLTALAPQITAAVRTKVEAADPDLDADLAQWWADSSMRPRLQVLGPLKMRVGAGGDPARVASRVGYYTELAAYLATRHGATTSEVADAMGVSDARVRKDISVLRGWLGSNPATGGPWVPDATRHPRAIERGVGLYLIEGLLVDADLFRRLRARGQARGPEGVDDLVQALRLVHGAPYDDMRARGGIWLAESREDQYLLCAVVDVAHTVSTIALAAGDLVLAKTAAELALLAAPSETTPQLDLAAIAAQSGDTSLAAAITHDLISWRDAAGDPADLPARAEEILRRHRWSDTAAS